VVYDHSRHAEGYVKRLLQVSPDGFAHGGLASSMV
jgi:hypothetical protein